MTIVNSGHISKGIRKSRAINAVDFKCSQILEKEEYDDVLTSHP